MIRALAFLLLQELKFDDLSVTLTPIGEALDTRFYVPNFLIPNNFFRLFCEEKAGGA